MMETSYECVPQKCGCVDTFPCTFLYSDEEYILKTRNPMCKISIENMYLVDVETQKQVEIIEQMEW